MPEAADVHVKTRNGGTVLLSERAIHSFSAALRGQLLLPASA